MRRLLLSYALFIATLLSACAVGPTSPSATSEKTVYVSPETTDSLLVSYQADFRKRVAAAGESNFPRVKGVPMYGGALMAVTVFYTGVVESVDVIQSSAEEIAVHSAQLDRAMPPFAPFSPDLRARAARVVMVVRLNYAK